MANEPDTNHWWNVPLYLTARGLTTSVMPHPTGSPFQIDFDFLEHRLDIDTVDGDRRSIKLESQPVASFYEQVMAALADLGVATEIWPVPVEIPGAIPFPDDQQHSSYDPHAVQRFWRALMAMEFVFRTFRSRFIGKVSPVHLFWGALDVAVTRFSGRRAPLHPGGAPNCGPHVMWEAYSHEVSSAGYWPGAPGAEGVFYSYAYPEPTGLPRRGGGARRRPLRRGPRRVRPALRDSAHRRRPRRAPALVPADHLRSRGGHRAVGPRHAGAARADQLWGDLTGPNRPGA